MFGLEPEFLQHLLLAVSTVAALVSVVVAYLLTIETQRTAETDTYVTFRNRFLDAHFQRQLEALTAWKSKYDADFVAQFLARLSDGEPEAVAVDDARRAVSEFFTDIARLYKGGLVRRRVARAISANRALHIYYEICEPISLQRNDGALTEHRKIMRAIRKSYRSGEV